MPTRLAATLVRLAESGHLLGRLAGERSAHRMSPLTVRALVVLQFEGPMGVTALARRCHVAQPTMTALVRHAEEAGWMRRRGSARTTQLEPTAAGIAARDEQREADGVLLEPRFTHLGRRERAALERAALILASTLERDRP
ncbi:MarR family transcriptional regulator [Agrococcus sp. SCSIO52902]|uniref:MarR family winged helix-turn-helix transcriptional regulator n=1 Tax=Agrococcus sp. SCSIO52902 TaxID=2933290 RepID=UPI001FF6CEC1|nr:MarR family transcriptional regulator [Agrococcus sp. SCSIO52902]UOV99856.1 MarR family transcriptional regulator [Agrococcus sp. SCSIO52902]